MADAYIQELIRTIENTQIVIKNMQTLDYAEGIKRLQEVFNRHKEQGSHVFFIGNGGSSAIASHMTADFMKNGGMNTYSLYDNAVTT